MGLRSASSAITLLQQLTSGLIETESARTLMDVTKIETACRATYPNLHFFGFLQEVSAFLVCPGQNAAEHC